MVVLPWGCLACPTQFDPLVLTRTTEFHEWSNISGTVRKIKWRQKLRSFLNSRLLRSLFKLKKLISSIFTTHGLTMLLCLVEKGKKSWKIDLVLSFSSLKEAIIPWSSKNLYSNFKYNLLVLIRNGRYKWGLCALRAK